MKIIHRNFDRSSDNNQFLNDKINNIVSSLHSTRVSLVSPRYRPFSSTYIYIEHLTMSSSSGGDNNQPVDHTPTSLEVLVTRRQPIKNELST